MEEMDFLEHYLAIQRIRFGDRLRFETNLAPEVKYALVPCLVVQPLMENAIRHGISSRSTGGTVVVSAQPVEEQLEIRVSDDGVGLPPGWTLESGAGLGLSVTRERIGGLHPNGASGFVVRRRRSGGTEAVIRLPLRFSTAMGRQERPAMVPSRTEDISVLVVDDEAPARLRLVDLLRRQPVVGTILEAEDGAAAVETIEKRRLDLVFLDVQMPELDGLAVLDHLVGAVGVEAMPLTVFVTAYEQHAVRAFEANALDYLLKPFSDERFEATMARAQTRLDERSLHEFGQRLVRMISAEPATQRRLDRLVVKSGGATRFIRVVDIDWIEAAGVYVNLHINYLSGQPSGSKEVLYRSSLAELADRLDPARFIRVHRSTMVNIESILQLEPISHGEFDVVLKSGARTRISRSYRAQLEQRLGQSL